GREAWCGGVTVHAGAGAWTRLRSRCQVLLRAQPGDGAGAERHVRSCRPDARCHPPTGLFADRSRWVGRDRTGRRHRGRRRGMDSLHSGAKASHPSEPSTPGADRSSFTGRRAIRWRRM
ncbi:MAG: hypothetical protein AVDCRST_MAG19-1645, partial [uncultured Thermomicrobiales bacterium]